MLRNTTAILALVVFLLVTLLAFATPQTLTGTVTDTMCGKKHMMPGKSDADCTRECMKSKGNWTYGLVVGNKVYGLAGDNKQFDTHAGKRVTISGELTGSKITVQRIAPAK